MWFVFLFVGGVVCVCLACWCLIFWRICKRMHNMWFVFLFVDALMFWCVCSYLWCLSVVYVICVFLF